MPDRVRPARILIVLPSWVGDSVMATPALRVIRRALPGALIGALARPGIDEVLAGTPFIDEFHVDVARGMMGPKRVASRLRIRRYDAAVLLTNSFSTALTVRLAGVPRRVGYDRDGRGLLLTERLDAPRRRDTEPFSRSSADPDDWAPVAACAYYFELARALIAPWGAQAGPMGPLELCVRDAERAAAKELLDELPGDGPLVVLNPGGNNPAKRWPAERFALLGTHLAQRGARLVVSGSSSEADVTAAVVRGLPEPARRRTLDMPALLAARGPAIEERHKVSGLGLLKGLLGRAALMVTNDTGPRHIAAALGVPVVSLFGPTDHRWTSIPFDRERIIVADPSLPEEEVANDHPARCAIEKIEPDRVIAAADALLTLGAISPGGAAPS
ncbi:MAG: glycosyltransferase family 9 protein [Planctomycetota bacterium]|nr:glycosyltransferase family 9 protein [Planctomycetota bacterium]